MSSQRLHNGRIVPPIEERFAPPPGPIVEPRPMRRLARRRAGRSMFWAALISVWLMFSSATAVVVLRPDIIVTIAALFPVQPVAIGMASALALYLYNLPDGSPVSVANAVKRAVAGGIFGLIAAKLGDGFGLNQSLQTAAAGVGGARGPDYIDKIADKLARS